MTETPFYAWSIAQALSWLIDVPVIGFIMLVLLALVSIGIVFKAIMTLALIEHATKWY